MAEIFKATGKNGLEISVEKHFFSPTAQIKSHKSTKGVVLLGIVRAGKLSEYDEITLTFDGVMTRDTVVRLEKQYGHISKAEVGDAIGICLQKTSREDIRKYLIMKKTTVIKRDLRQLLVK